MCKLFSQAAWRLLRASPSTMAPLAAPEISGAICVDVDVVQDESSKSSYYVLKRMQRFGGVLVNEMGKLGVGATVLTFEGAGLVKGMGRKELSEIAGRVRLERPETLVVNLGFNDYRIQAEDTTGMSRLHRQIDEFQAMGATHTVFVVPDDSDKSEFFGCRGSVVNSVREALRNRGARSVILPYAGAEPSSAQKPNSVHADNFHYTARGQHTLVRQHARQLAGLGCTKIVVVTDSSWTSHDYCKVPFDAARGVDTHLLGRNDLERFAQSRWKHPRYDRSFSFLQLLRFAARDLNDLNGIVALASQWRRESTKTTPTIGGRSLASYITLASVCNGLGAASARKACQLWAEDMRSGNDTEEVIGEACATGAPLARLLATFRRSIRTRLVMAALLRCRIPR